MFGSWVWGRGDSDVGLGGTDVTTVIRVITHHEE